jgi:hypothetical protein
MIVAHEVVELPEVEAVAVEDSCTVDPPCSNAWARLPWLLRSATTVTIVRAVEKCNADFLARATDFVDLSFLRGLLIGFSEKLLGASSFITFSSRKRISLTTVFSPFFSPFFDMISWKEVR